MNNWRRRQIADLAGRARGRRRPNPGGQIPIEPGRPAADRGHGAGRRSEGHPARQARHHPEHRPVARAAGHELGRRMGRRAAPGAAVAPRALRRAVPRAVGAGSRRRRRRSVRRPTTGRTIHPILPGRERPGTASRAGSTGRSTPASTPTRGSTVLSTRLVPRIARRERASPRRRPSLRRSRGPAHAPASPPIGGPGTAAQHAMPVSEPESRLGEQRRRGNASNDPRRSAPRGP